MTREEPDILKDGHIDVAHPLAEKFAEYRLTGEEWQVLWVIMRRTWGWHKPWHPISLIDFFNATGIKKPNVLRALKKLRGRGVISRRRHANPYSWHINSHLKTWEPLSKSEKKPLSKEITDNTQTLIRRVKQEATTVIQKDNVIKKDNNVIKTDNEGVIKTDNVQPLELPLDEPHGTPKERVLIKEKKTNKERKPSCRNFSNSDELLKFCDNLRMRMEALILGNKPDYKFRGGVNRAEKWTREFRLMVERDSRRPESIGMVMEWALNNPFWRSNILSPRKLRMQFDALELRMGSRKSAVTQKDWLLFATARSRLEKSCSFEAVLSELEKLDVRLHNELRKFLDKTYRQGHSYQKAKDEYEKRHNKGS